jgi:putative transposase
VISFARGLILRKGMRELEFERQIEREKVQFKFLDTHEVMTFNLAKLYKQIQEGEYAVVTSQYQESSARQEDEPLKLPSIITKGQEALIAFRLKFVLAAIKNRITRGAIDKLSELLNRIEDFAGIDDEETRLAQKFKKPSVWALRRWIVAYEDSGSNPYVLLDRRAIRRTTTRLSKAIENFIDQSIIKVYLQLRGPSIRRTHQSLAKEIRVHNQTQGDSLKVPSLSTLERRIEKIPGYVVDFKRYGPAYAKNKWRYSLAGDQSTRILERVEVDHTLLDVWVLDPRLGIPLGRPWVTVLIDRYSGYIQGIYVSFYGPSSATVASALKIAITPKSDLLAAIPDVEYEWTAMGVPELLVVDNGMEFHSVTFRRITWELRSDVIYNPVRQPWLKSSIERTMMEVNRTLPNDGRVFTPIKNAERIDPSKTALIEFYDLCRCLMVWAVDQHPRSIHPKTLIRPIDLWEDGLLEAPPPRLPLHTKQLDLSMGIHASRVVDGDGVFFKYLRYNSEELQYHLRSLRGKFRADLRINPDNISSMHVHIPKSNEWIVVPMQSPSPTYGNGLSLMQHELIRSEAKGRLTKSNAFEELERTRERVEEMWCASAKRGKSLKKTAELIKSQGLTSAKLVEDDAPVAQIPIPELSPIAEKNLPKVIPFKGFTMSEDD